MMRKPALMMMFFAVIFFIAGTAVAKDKKYYVGISGVYALENLDEQQTKDKFTGPITIDFDDSWGVQVRGGYIISNIYTVEAMFEYIAPFDAMTGSNTDELDVKNLTVNLKVTCPANESIVPYLIAGAGVMNAHEDITFNGANSETSDWGLGIRGGIGVDFYVNDEFSMELEGVYTGGFGEVDHIKYTVFSLGIAYHF